jgi:hypothetical protein
MAQSFVTDAGVLIIPGAYPTVKVQNGASGLSTTGVIFLVGEADGGPDFTKEADLTLNSYGPDQVADVVAKYKSGPLVDAMKAAAQPANDPDIVGAPSLFYIIKTNPSTKASSGLTKFAGGSYSTLADKGYGQLGNLIYFEVDETSETSPGTNGYTYIGAVATTHVGFRVNGGAQQLVAVGAAALPSDFVTDCSSLVGITVDGGANRSVLTVSGTLAVGSITGNQATFTRSIAWAAQPRIGDTLVIPTGSVISDSELSNNNVGHYVVIGATTNTVTAIKLSDAGRSGAVTGVITAPHSFAATSVAAVTDLEVFGPVFIEESGAQIDGIARNLEINEVISGMDEAFSNTAYVFGTTTPVSWISKTGTPALLRAANERSIVLKVNRQLDNVQESFSVGGKVALGLGYAGTSCGVVVGPTTMVLTPVGGDSDGQTITILLKHYPTVADLVAYLGTLAGFSAAVATTTLGQFSPLGLDEGTFTCASTTGNNTLLLKNDAVSFYNLVTQNSALTTLSAIAVAGLPAAQTTTFLTGGALGATSDATYDSAIDALESLKGNFVVPLFSRDATSDIADDLTDSESSYTIANIQAYAKTHCLKMSTLKRRRNRQAFLSQRDTFANDENAAAILASARCSLAFQDQKVVGSNGIIQAQPYMGAALAAGMQAAGFYRAIVNKGINCNGVLQAAGDWKDSSDTDMEKALLAGLLPARKNDDGGFTWVSDQTTYSKDNNFVYNSIQAVYVTDIIALTCAQRMEKAFVGQSVADVSAALALAALEAIMADFLRLKLIAVSDDAPKGFKNATIKISGTTMVVNVEIKLAGAIYFIPINFLVSQVTQVAA